MYIYDRHYIGNFRKCYEPFFNAVIEHGDIDYVFIDPMPAPIENTGYYEIKYYAKARPSMIGDYFSMYSLGQRDLSDFWAFVNEMKLTQGWAEWYRLIDDQSF